MRLVTTNSFFSAMVGLVLLISALVNDAQSAKLITVSILDRDYLVVNISDGDVIHQD